MDRKYLEEHLSAFLDGELTPEEMHEFQHELGKHPDLAAELQTLQRLDKLARDSQVPLPADKYFDDLSGRIDARIKDERPRRRSRIIDFVVERRKSLAIISSVAAVFLVAVIGMNIFGPSAKRYPSQLRDIKTSPSLMLDEDKTQDSTNGETQSRESAPDLPVSREEERTRAVPMTKPKILKKDVGTVSDAVSSSSSVPSPIPDTVPNPVPEPHGAVASEAQMVETAPGKLTSKAEANSPALQSLSAGRSLSGEVSTAATAFDTVIIFTETITAGTNDSKYSLPMVPKSKNIQPSALTLRDSDARSWSVYLNVFKELDRGVYSGWKLSALTISLDSLQAWKDSLNTLGPARWYAEEAFRSLQTKEATWEDYQRWRAYIDHYLAESQIPDSAIWNRRLPIVNEIYERQIGKQYQDKE